MAPKRQSLSAPPRSKPIPYAQRAALVKKSAADLFLEATDILAAITRPTKCARISKPTTNDKTAIGGILEPSTFGKNERSLNAAEAEARKTMDFEELFEQFIDGAVSGSIDGVSTTTRTSETTAETTHRTTLGTSPRTTPEADSSVAKPKVRPRSPLPHSYSAEQLVQYHGWTISAPSEVKSRTTTTTPTSYILTRPNGKTVRNAFRNLDSKGNLMLRVNSNEHNIHGIGGIQNISSSFRVLIVCDAIDLKAIHRNLSRAEGHLFETVTNALFPKSFKEEEIEWKGVDKIRWVDSKGRDTGRYRMRAIQDYCVEYDDKYPQVVIVQIDLVGSVVLTRIYQDKKLRRTVNRYVWNKEEKERKGIRSEKRAWVDDDGQDDRRRKCPRVEEADDGNTKSLSDDETWKQWLNEPRITIEGMENFNADDLVGPD